MVTASCSKEQRTDGNAPVFRAGVEKNTKTSFSEATNLVWTDGDQVAIYGSASAPATYHPENIQEDAQYCDLVVTEGNPGDGPYTAIYPVSIAKNSTTVTLPAVQASVAGELTAYPMYAQSNSTVLSFKNLCSVLKITMQKANTTVSKIQIVTDQYLNGDFTVNYNGGTPTLEYVNTGSVNNHTKITTLTFANNVSIDESHDFYFYLPANTYNHFQIKVYDAAGNFFTSTSNRPLTFNRSVYNKLTIPASAINFYPGDLNGLFSVSSTQKVSFSKGDLYTSGDSYYFADEQYTITMNNTSPYFFQWTSSSNALYFNPVANGGENNAIWRVLTYAQWNYLFNTRTVQYTRPNNSTYNYRYSMVKINGKEGMLLFPDLFYWPLELNREPSNFNGANLTSTSRTNYTLNEWKKLEEAGCVFLPITGRIELGNPALHARTTYAYYWCSDLTNGRSRVIYFTPTSTPYNESYQLDGRLACAIRLVKYA